MCAQYKGITRDFATIYSTLRVIEMITVISYLTMIELKHYRFIRTKSAHFV